MRKNKFRNKIVRFLKNFLLVLFGVVLSLILIEVLVRLLPSKITKIDFTIKTDARIFDYLRVYKYKPDSERNWTSLGPVTIWHFNNYGFRERAVQDKKVEGNVYRILVIGDSITMGLGVEDYEAFPRQMEKILNPKEFDPKKTIFEVLNFGLWAEGPRQYEETLREFASKLKPDLVIIGYFSGNDTSDDVYYTKTIKLRLLKALPDMLLPYRVNEFLKNDSYLYQLFLTRYYTLVQSTDVDMNNNDQTAKEGWEINKGAILDMKRIADKIGAKFLILGLPSDIEIVKGKDYLYVNRIEELGSLSKEQDINYLDLYPYFMNNPKRNTLFITGDTHYTPLGHQFTAQVIVDYLHKQGLTPGN